MQIVIPCRNGYLFLPRCLHLVRKYTDNADITIIDNGHEDESFLPKMSKLFDVEIVKNTKLIPRDCFSFLDFVPEREDYVFILVQTYCRLNFGANLNSSNSFAI